MQLANARVKIHEVGSDVAVFNITPAEALLINKDQEANAKGQAVTGLTIIGEEERSNRDEVARLKAKYANATNKERKLWVDVLFPGENPNLPKTFKEAGLEAASTVAK